MNVLTSDQILEWISIKTVDILEEMRKALQDETWDRLRGAADVLEELRHYILIETNPHNREDIEEFKRSLYDKG